MKNRNNSFLTMATIAGALYPGYSAYAQTVGDHILSDVRADASDQCATMTIEFNARFQILSYFPQTSGNELHIRLQPLDETSIQTESLRPPGNVPVVTSIRYEGDNAAGPTLSITFSRTVHFKVAAGERPQTIVISTTDSPSGNFCLAVPMAQPTVESLEPAHPQPQQGTALSRPTAPLAVNPQVAPGLYVVNLLSQQTAIGDLPPAKASKLSGHIVYESRFEKDAQSWHRLRLGFYESYDDAQAAARALKADFPDAWVSSVSEAEREQGIASQLVLAGGAPVAAPQPVSTAPATATETTQAVKLEADAEAAIKAGDPDRAVQLLTNALALPPNDHSPRARELLGITRERKGQLAHAKAEYEEYLQLYPTNEGAPRVRQRLAALLNPATAAASSPLRAASGGGRASGAPGWRWGMRGSFSQYYYYDKSSTKFQTATNDPKNPVDPVVTNSANLNLLQNTADITISGGNDRTQLQLRAAGSYVNNFRRQPATDLTGAAIPGVTVKGPDTKSLSALYFDYTDRSSGLEVRLGRQNRNNQGVFGRFDGGLVTYAFTPKIKMNLVSGFPVNSSTQLSVNTYHPFYGLSVDLGARRDKFQTSFYVFDQENKVLSGLNDRRAVGMEARYFTPKFNAFTVVDYDVKFNRLNLGIATLNYTASDQSSLSITADYRESPLLVATNAFTGSDYNNVPLLTFADLRNVAGLTNDQLTKLAIANTSITKSLTLAYSRPVSKKVQTNFDVAVTDTGGTLGSQGIGGLNFTYGGIDPRTGLEAGVQPAVGKEYFFGGQVIGTGFFRANDIYILSGRYSDTQRNHTYVGDISARLPVNAKLRVNPRIRYSFRTDKLDAGNLTQLQPSLRMNWYPMRHAEVEFEGGAYLNKTKSFNSTTNLIDSTRESGLLINIGYRLDF